MSMTMLNRLITAPALCLLLAVLVTRAPLISMAARDGDDWFTIDTEAQGANLARLAGYGEEKLSSVLIRGSVLCNPCMGSNAESVSGAMVILRCRRGRKTVRIEGLADKWGEFTIELPSELHAWPMLETSCKVTVPQMPKNSGCYSGHHMEPRSAMKELSGSNGLRVYDAGTLWITNKHSCL
ncbi:unnamed protein product [Victoria cruziana]